jgi:hypothetical protein
VVLVVVENFTAPESQMVALCFATSWP